MKTNLTIGTIHVPNYVVSCIEKAYHSNEMISKNYKSFKINKEKSKQISQDSSFEEILKQKIHSMEKR